MSMTCVTVTLAIHRINVSLLPQIFLSKNNPAPFALKMHPNTFYSFIPQNLVYKKATTKTRREIKEDLLPNDSRSKS